MKLRPDKKEERVATAKIRQEHWEKLSPQQQLEQIDLRLGKGVGAKRQREKINSKILQEQQKNKE